MHKCMHAHMGRFMNDMLKLRMPIKASHVDVDSEGRHCIFGFNLLDLDLPRVEARCVFKDEEGNVVNQVLNHPYDRLPTSFTKMAWKFHHEGKLWPHVELKASPAKILQGHNVYGTDWIEEGAMEMLGHFALAQPTLYGMLEIGETEVMQIDVTYHARLRDDREVERALDSLRNISTQHIRKSSKAAIYKNTVYFGSERCKRFARKVYGKSCEFLAQLIEQTKLAKSNDKAAQAVVKVMSDPDLISFTQGLLRFETGVKAYVLKERNIPTNLFQLIRYQRQNPYFLRNLWTSANRELFEALKGQNMKLTDDDSIYNKILSELQLANSKDSISSSVADTVFKFYRDLENVGCTVLQTQMGDEKFFRNFSNLLKCGFAKNYLVRLHVNPLENMDHLSAYNFVFREFKKVVKAGSASATKARNLHTFYKELRDYGFETVRGNYSKAQFSKRIVSLKECGFSTAQLQNLHSQTSNNIIPFIKYVEINFDQQVPENFIEPKSSFNLKIA